MNKIYIDTRNYNLELTKDITYLMEIEENDCTLEIKNLKNVKATVNFLVKNSKVNLDINLEDSTDLIINLLALDSSINISSNILKNSNLRCGMGIISNCDSINEIKINHKCSDSKSVFTANGINLGLKKFYFTINGLISKDSVNVYLEENSKIINIKDGDSKIIPNLIVDNKEVSANHAAFIGKFADSLIWYLNSRGIKREDAYRFLISATLLNGMTYDLETENIFKEFIETIKKN